MKDTKKQIADIVTSIENLLSMTDNDKPQSVYLLFGVVIPQLLTAHKSERVRFGRELDKRSTYVALVAASRFFRLMLQDEQDVTDDDAREIFMNARAIGDVLHKSVDLSREFKTSQQTEEEAAAELFDAYQFPIFKRGDA